MAGNELMVYLYNVYQLEKQKYDMKYAFERVQTEINEAKNSIEKNANITYQKQKEVIPTEESTFSSIATGIFLGIIYGGVFGYIAAWIGFLIDIISKKAVGLGGMIDKALEIILSFIWPLMLLLMEVSFEEWRTMWNFKLFIIVFLLSICIWLCLGIISSKDACRNAIKEKEQIAEENERIAKANETLKYNSRRLILSNQNYIDNVLVPEQEKLQLIYKRTDILLDKLYSLNVIGEKYRNLVAVSSFYEYLKYGRCDTLTGVDGAYNKFEDELYKKQIIAKLDEVIFKLDEIKDNQFMLYNAIREAQQQREQLCSDLQQMMRLNNSNQQAIRESLDRLDYNAQRIEVNLEVERYWREMGIK